MVGVPIQLAPLYVIVISNLGLNWDKMNALVWVRAHNYLCLSLTLHILLLGVYRKKYQIVEYLFNYNTIKLCKLTDFKQIH